MAEYIEREALIERLKFKRDCVGNIKTYAGLESAISQVKKAPAADVVEVVRCKDCKHFNMREMECQNDAVSTDHEGGASYILNFYLDDFCSYGERRNNHVE